MYKSGSKYRLKGLIGYKINRMQGLCRLKFERLFESEYKLWENCKEGGVNFAYIEYNYVTSYTNVLLSKKDNNDYLLYHCN